jgi:hypothetical protein
MTAKRVIDVHAEFEGLGADDHAQYLLLAGRAGGQTAYGGTAATDHLNLYPNTQTVPPTNFATDGFLNAFGRVLFQGFSDLTAPPGINYQLIRHNEVVDCSGQGSVIPQGFWYTPTFDYNTVQTFGGASTFQDGSIWRESAFITGSHGTFSLGSFLGGPRYQVNHAGPGNPPSGIYAYNATPAADLIGGTSLTMPVMAGYTTNFPFPLQAFLGLEPLRNGAVCTRYSHFKAYSNIPSALTLHGGSTITTEVGLDLQNLARGTTAISIFSDALGAYMDHAGLITYSLDMLRLGTSASTSHGLGAGDVLIGAGLEVDGASFFDSEATIESSPTTALQYAVRGTCNFDMATISSSSSAAILATGKPTGTDSHSALFCALFGEMALNNTYSTGTLGKIAAVGGTIGGFNTGTAATITEAASFRAQCPGFPLGFTVQNLAGLWIENLSTDGVTNLYPIYQVGPNGMNYLGSKTQIEQKESNQFALLVSRNINEAGAFPLVRLIEDHTGSSQAVLGLQNDGTGPHIITLGTNEDLELNPNGTGLTRAIGGARVDSADAIYFGNPLVDGTWRIIRSGNDFVFQRRESSVYVTKSTVSA